jgi:hypothetical protein
MKPFSGIHHLNHTALLFIDSCYCASHAAPSCPRSSSLACLLPSPIQSLQHLTVIYLMSLTQLSPASYLPSRPDMYAYVLQLYINFGPLDMATLDMALYLWLLIWKFLS